MKRPGFSTSTFAVKAALPIAFAIGPGVNFEGWSKAVSQANRYVQDLPPEIDGDFYI
jgi:hypothetical protein